jgi:predicted regulator of Ras-like GTPase activity (Roadblock/LC7/MglB family)
MELTGNTKRRVLLWSLLLVIAPMVAFPARLGTELARVSLITAFYEIVFYGIVLFCFNRRATLLQLLQASGGCFVYRIGMGTLFGVMIAAAYGINLRLAVTSGLSSYLPAIILHVVATPFILKPALMQLLPKGKEERRMRHEDRQVLSSQFPTTSSGIRSAARAAVPSPIVEETAVPETIGAHRSPYMPTESEPSPTHTGDVNGFDRATKYVGEHGSVSLVCVVDREGLLVSHFRRGDIVAEDWAPFALMLVQGNETILKRCDVGRPDRIDVALGNTRLIVVQVQEFFLMVVADRQSDDLLNIRFNQAADLIGKFISERYGRQIPTGVEKAYVSST